MVSGAAHAFEPEQRQVVLEDGERLGYSILVVAPGLALDWDAIPGLKDTLGQNGVTSNYLFDLAPYTWELVQSTRKGKALFTSPNADQMCWSTAKAMYLACDHWLRQSRLQDMEVEFCTAGAALFGVADYVPALMKYVEVRHPAEFPAQPDRRRWSRTLRQFKVTDAEGNTSIIEKAFDMMHVCPPQKAPKFISESPLADEAGWIALNPETLQHSRYGDIFGLGDAGNTPNAKTAAAVRKQAPVVAENILLALKGEAPRAIYDGYGSCPLTVERGKIVLAEFGYGGKLLPSFPEWLVDGKQPSSFSWLLKEKMLPWIYWNAMLKGHEWLAKPEVLRHSPLEQEAQQACNFADKK